MKYSEYINSKVAIRRIVVYRETNKCFFFFCKFIPIICETVLFLIKKLYKFSQLTRANNYSTYKLYYNTIILTVSEVSLALLIYYNNIV